MHNILHTVYTKCIFCLRKDVCFFWWKPHSFWVHGLWVAVRRIILSPVLPSAMYNFHLQVNPSIQDTYARQTTASRIGFWYYYNSSKTPLHEPATCSHFWTQVQINSSKYLVGLHVVLTEHHQNQSHPWTPPSCEEKWSGETSHTSWASTHFLRWCHIATFKTFYTTPTQERYGYLSRGLKTYCCKGSAM